MSPREEVLLRGAAIVLAVSLVLVLASACAEDSRPAGSLRAAAPVVRLGEPSGRASAGDVTRPVLPPEVEATLPLADLPAGRIFLAAARRDGPSARCEARLEAEDAGPARPPTVLALPEGEPRWVEGRLALPAGFRGRLLLRCTQAEREEPAVVWARPVVAPHSERPAPLVVLLSLDTLRADRVPGFGGDPDVAPNLGRLAAEGVRMTATTAWGTWTLPSHMALLEARLFPFDERRPGGFGLAARVGHLAGLATVGITGGGWVSAKWRFDRSFDVYVEHRTAGADLDLVLADARDTLARLSDVPTFLFVHTYEVHQLGPDATEYLRRYGHPIRLGPAALERERAFYDALVRRADARLGSFFDLLRRQAATRPVLLVVVSDHGEAFGEHGFYGHGKNAWTPLHDEIVRVPLIAWGPGRVPGGRASDRPTMLLDVVPTLAEAVGLSPPERTGESLWAFWSGAREAPPASDGSVSYVDRGWTLRDAPTKLIVRIAEDGEEHLELYDLAEDPEAQHDLATVEPARARDARRRLLARLAALGIEPAAPGRLPRPDCWAGDRSGCDAHAPREPELPAADGELREQLRALGYLE